MAHKSRLRKALQLVDLHIQKTESYLVITSYIVIYYEGIGSDLKS